MRTITIDCTNTSTVTDFWAAYVTAASPEVQEYFGRNLDAFWDAVSAGSPGWPRQTCELRFINTSSIKKLDNGRFYEHLKAIAVQSEFVRIYIE